MVRCTQVHHRVKCITRKSSLWHALFFEFYNQIKTGDMSKDLIGVIRCQFETVKTHHCILFYIFILGFNLHMIHCRFESSLTGNKTLKREDKNTQRVQLLRTWPICHLTAVLQGQGWRDDSGLMVLECIFDQGIFE